MTRFDDIRFTSKKQFLTEMQKNNHEVPEPRPIKHVVLDADDTIWRIKPWGIISYCEPIGESNENELSCKTRDDRRKGTIQLDPTLRDTIQMLKDRSIGVSIASVNEKQAVTAALNAFGLLDAFSQIEADFERDKGAMVCAIGVKEGVLANEILFVDDSFYNVEDVERLGALSLQMDIDINGIAEILDFIK